MNVFLYKKSTGDIVAFKGNVDAGEPVIDTPELGQIETTEPTWTTTLYVKNGQLTPRPERPSREHEWNGSTWVPNTSQVAQMARLQRNELLTASDWSDLASAPQRLGGQVYQQWQVYRQALRDITSQPGFPLNITWPTPPS